MDSVILIGGGGHAKQIIEIISAQGLYRIAGITDNDPTKRKMLVAGVPIIGNDKILNTYFKKGIKRAFISLGSVDETGARISLYNMLKEIGFVIINVVHSSAIISPTVTMDTGNAIMAGFDVNRNIDDVKKIIGVCPQEASVFSFLNARENIELFGKLHSLSKKEIQDKTEKYLKIMGLTEASKRKTGGYSGGMLRKLNLIMALIHDPKIAFLDEPTVGMDARARRNTWEFIGSLKDENRTIILTTHYIEEAEALSDRVGIIDYGKLIELGTPHELMEKYNAKNLEEVFLNITGRRITEGI